MLTEALAATTEIKDYSEYTSSPAFSLRYWIIDSPPMPDDFEWPSKQWDSYKMELGENALLLTQINNQQGFSFVETSLIGTAVHLIIGVETILNASDATEVFQIATTEDRENGIDNAVRQILINYIAYVPLVLTQAMDEAFKDSIKRYVKTEVEPELQEHWKAIGLPSDYDVLAAWHLPTIAKDADEVRKYGTGVKKPLIPDSLPQLYDGLRKEYVRARQHYRRSKNVFLSSKNSLDQWHVHWADTCLSYFPTLSHSCLIALCVIKGQQHELTASELAQKHLSLIYRRTPEYLKKKVSDLRALAKTESPTLQVKNGIFEIKMSRF